LSTIKVLVDELMRALVAFEPAALADGERAEMAACLARAAKACEAACARVGGPVDMLARVSGGTLAGVRSALAAVSAAEACAATSDALKRGEISLAQAAEIASVPEHEPELLELARKSSLGPVRDAARGHRLAAIPPEELSKRQRASRTFRHWRDEIGMVCFFGALPPDEGVAFVNRLDRETDREWRAAWREKRPEARGAHAADALVKLTEGRGKRGGTDLVLVVDLNAYRRGHAHEGEPCHIVGGGPIPVDVARELSEDAFVKAVLHDGVEIHTVAHFGRHIPAHLRTALELGAPPDFEGVKCSDEGCERRYGLQWDHVDPCANGGMTSFRNLQPLCTPGHFEKTERDRRAGLLSPEDPP
jgi:hypothetical protein